MLDRGSSFRSHEVGGFDDVGHPFQLLVQSHGEVNTHRTGADRLINLVVRQVGDEDDPAFELEGGRQIAEGRFRVPRDPTFVVAVSSSLDQVDGVGILLDGIAIVENDQLAVVLEENAVESLRSGVALNEDVVTSLSQLTGFSEQRFDLGETLDAFIFAFIFFVISILLATTLLVGLFLLFGRGLFLLDLHFQLSAGCSVVCHIVQAVVLDDLLDREGLTETAFASDQQRRDRAINRHLDQSFQETEAGVDVEVHCFIFVVNGSSDREVFTTGVRGTKLANFLDVCDAVLQSPAAIFATDFFDDVFLAVRGSQDVTVVFSGPFTSFSGKVEFGFGSGLRNVVHRFLQFGICCNHEMNYIILGRNVNQILEFNERFFALRAGLPTHWQCS